MSLLYTFPPQPNTAVYAGYGDVLSNDLDPVTGAHAAGLQRQARTVFLKLSYTFRR